MARQRQQTAAAQDRARAPQARISFRKGVLYVNEMRQTIVRLIKRMSSNETTQYTAIEWSDPVTGDVRTSCNCPGWANRRACKHATELENDQVIGTDYDIATDLPRQITAKPIAAAATNRFGKALRGFTFED